MSILKKFSDCCQLSLQCVKRRCQILLWQSLCVSLVDLHDVDMQCVGRVGRVIELRDNAVLVKFTGIDQAFHINPAVLSPAVLSTLFALHHILYRSLNCHTLVGALVQRVRHLGLRPVGRGFKSCSRQRCVTTLGKLFIPMCLCHQAV